MRISYWSSDVCSSDLKPGNIAEWVRRFGAAYEYMIVLDADSLMSGRAMVQLASVMDRAPGVGLIQTIPTVINSRTLFARWQQFAASAYGTIAGAGLIWRSEEHPSELPEQMRIS